MTKILVVVESQAAELIEIASIAELNEASVPVGAKPPPRRFLVRSSSEQCCFARRSPHQAPLHEAR
jgi:hypothetical protein